MLTDIFAYRYADTCLWEAFSERDRRFLYQAFQILRDELIPYYDDDGKADPVAKEKWKSIHDKLGTELGQKQLSPHAYPYPTQWQGRTIQHTGFYTLSQVCENFVTERFDGPMAPDRFMKERISLIELGFQEQYAHVVAKIKSLHDELQAPDLPPNLRVLRIPGDRKVGIRARITRLQTEFQAAVDQLNARIRQAGYSLTYHNGLVQISTDDLIEEEVEKSFWSLVAGDRWKNVDHDIKEAIDLRDNRGRDPAFYAAKALESAIKIISDEKGWSHGGEKGAHHYIDNIGSKKSMSFIAAWERDALKDFFKHVRNPFGHGPGSMDMPSLTPPQTDWAIGFCMIWIRSLIQRI